MDQGGGTGWFNGTNWAFYSDHDYDYEKAQAACLEAVKKEIAYKLENPKEAAEFFREKVISMWLESSHGAFLGNRVDYRTVLWNHSRIYNDLFAQTGKLHRIVSLFLEIYQIFVYLGAILYILYAPKTYDVTRLTGLVIFLGGFLFHLFWEAHSSYSFIYFILLIPYAVTGWNWRFDKIDGSLRQYKESRGNEICKEGSDSKEDRERQENKDCKNSTGSIQLLNNILPFLAGFLVIIVLGCALATDQDKEEWAAFYNEHQFIDEGCYYLESVGSGEVCGFDEGGKLFLSIDMSDQWQYEFSDLPQEKKLLVADGELRLAAADTEPYSQNPFCARWHIERKGGAYCIRWWQDRNKVMAYDAQTHAICLKDYEEGDRNQLWELKR